MSETWMAVLEAVKAKEEAMDLVCARWAWSLRWHPDTTEPKPPDPELKRVNQAEARAVEAWREAGYPMPRELTDWEMVEEAEAFVDGRGRKDDDL